MATEWPWALVTILAEGYELGAEPNVRRTPLEDGAIRQARSVTRSLDLRRFQIAVRASNVTAFRRWLLDHADGDITFTDWHDGTSRTVKIRGGRASVTLRRTADGERLDGERYMESQVELEGYI